MIETIKPWISAARPRTLPLSLSGIILGSFLAAYQGYFDSVILILAMLTTVSLQVLSNLANDYGDGVKGTDNENRLGPVRALQSGKVTPKQMLLALKLNVAITVILALALIYVSFNESFLWHSLFFISLAVASIYAAMRYTMGKSAYGYRGLGDIFVFVFFGLVSVLGTYFLYAKHLDLIIVLPATVVGLLSVGVLNLNNMRDRDSDILANKITLAVKMGAKNAKSYQYSLIILSMLCAICFALIYCQTPLNYLFLISFIPLSIHLIKIKKAKTASQFDVQLKPLALTTFAFALILGLGFVL